MRYWTLSKILELANEGKQPDKSKINRYNLVLWIGLAINFTISMLYGYFLYRGSNLEVVYIILPLLWISAFSFLLDGLRRIRKVMKTLSDRVVIFSAFLMQSLTCGLFILGQVPNLVFAIKSDTNYQYIPKYSFISIFPAA